MQLSYAKATVPKIIATNKQVLPVGLKTFDYKDLLLHRIGTGFQFGGSPMQYTMQPVRLFASLVVACCLAKRYVGAFEHREEMKCLQSSRNQTIECLKQGKITNYRSFECHNIISQGGCEKGERLVMVKGSQCPETECISNRDEQQTACNDGEIVYNGKCLMNGNRNECVKDGLGRALYADIYGEVSCQCAVHRGFLELDGVCHLEYLQGGCPVGQQVRRKNGTFTGMCQQHGCSTG